MRLQSIFGFGLAVFVGLSAMANIRVGNERFVPSKESSMSFLQCPAVATKTSSGVEIRFYGSAALTATERVTTTSGGPITAVIGGYGRSGVIIVGGEIDNGEKLKIIIPTGVEVVLNAVSGRGIRSGGSLEISGGGSLIINGVGDETAIVADDDIDISPGVSIKITSPSTGSKWGRVGGIHAVTGDLNILGSTMTITTHSTALSAGGKLSIRASLLNICAATPEKTTVSFI